MEDKYVPSKYIPQAFTNQNDLKYPTQDLMTKSNMNAVDYNLNHLDVNAHYDEITGHITDSRNHHWN